MGSRPAPRPTGVLVRAPGQRPGAAQRVLARPAGSADRAGAQAGRLRPLRTGVVGRRARGRRPSPTCPGLPRRGDLLHLRAHQQRSRVRLPTVRPGVRYQQPAGLLEHVPRKHERRARRDARRRQGERELRGLRQGRAHHHHGSEPRNQPPTNADHARGGQARRNHDRGDQSAAGSRTDAVQGNPQRVSGVVGPPALRSPTSSSS